MHDFDYHHVEMSVQRVTLNIYVENRESERTGEQSSSFDMRISAVLASKIFINFRRKVFMCLWPSKKFIINRNERADSFEDDRSRCTWL